MVRIVNKVPAVNNNNNIEDKSKTNITDERKVTEEKTTPVDAANVTNNKTGENINNNENDNSVTTYDSETAWEKDSDPHPRKKQKISLENSNVSIIRNNNNSNVANNKRCFVISRKEVHNPAEPRSENRNLFSHHLATQLRPVLVIIIYIVLGILFQTFL
jgi:hypothetical protein